MNRREFFEISANKLGTFGLGTSLGKLINEQMLDDPALPKELTEIPRPPVVADARPVLAQSRNKLEMNFREELDTCTWTLRIGLFQDVITAQNKDGEIRSEPCERYFFAHESHESWDDGRTSSITPLIRCLDGRIAPQEQREKAMAYCLRRANSGTVQSLPDHRATRLRFSLLMLRDRIEKMSPANDIKLEEMSLFATT